MVETESLGQIGQLQRSTRIEFYSCKDSVSIFVAHDFTPLQLYAMLPLIETIIEPLLHSYLPLRLAYSRRQSYEPSSPGAVGSCCYGSTQERSLIDEWETFMTKVSQR